MFETGIKTDDDCYELVCQAPAEISSLLYHFLRTSDDNYIKVGIPGKRKREVGLALPVEIFYAELSKCKESFVFLELLHK